MKKDELNRQGERLSRVMWLLVIVPAAAVIGVLYCALNLHNALLSVLCAVGGILLTAGISKILSARYDAWEKGRRECLNFDAILGEYLELERFEPDRGLDPSEIEDLFPQKPLYRLDQRNLIRGRWHGLRLDSAHVHYYNKTHDSDGVADTNSIVRGQVAIVQASTGFPGRLLLLRGQKDASPGLVRDIRNHFMDKRFLVKRLNLEGRSVDPGEALAERWYACSDASDAAARLLKANEVFVKRLAGANRLEAVLVESGRVALIGDYGFETSNPGLGVNRTEAACRSALSALVSEGLETVEALCGPEGQATDSE